jgi:chromate transporter
MWDLAFVFLRLGTTAFGGPAAHIAMMEDEFVRRRQWLSRERFLDLLGAVNLIPGPNSTEMAIYIGYLRAGWRGLVAAGMCFILPAMLMVMVIAWAYVQFGSLPQLAGLLYGVKPVVIAVVLQALWGLGRAAIKTRLLAILGLLAAVAGLLNVDVLSVILVAGLLSALERGLRPALEKGTVPVSSDHAGHGCAAVPDGARNWDSSPSDPPNPWQDPHRRFRPLLFLFLVVAAVLAMIHFATAAGSEEEVPCSLSAILFYFLKVGSVLYGSGYVLLAYLQTDLVEHWHWLTSTQLLDATAVGQVTPGPVFTTATFIGYVLQDVPGALLATLGIFLPSFIFIAISGPLIPRLRKSVIAGAFLDGVNVGSLALMAVVTWRLGLAAIVDAPTALLAAGSAILLMRYRVNSAWLILAGALMGITIGSWQAPAN